MEFVREILKSRPSSRSESDGGGFREGYAIVDGTFDATYGGHFSSHPGAITGVNRLEAWSIP